MSVSHYGLRPHRWERLLVPPVGRSFLFSNKILILRRGTDVLYSGDISRGPVKQC